MSKSKSDRWTSSNNDLKKKKAQEHNERYEYRKKIEAAMPPKQRYLLID